MGMGKIRSLAAVLLILFVLVAPGDLSRVLLDDGKVSQSPISNPISSSKSDHSDLSHRPPEKITNPAGSINPPPPSKREDNRQPNSTKDDGSKENSTNSKSSTDTSKDRPSEHGSPASKSKDDGKEGNRSQDKLTKDSVDKEIMDTCNSLPTKCRRENLVACLQPSGKDLKNLSLLVQNIGEDDITVKIRGTPALHIHSNTIVLSKKNFTKINLPIDDWNVTEIILDAGRGNCSLQIATTPVLDWNFFPGLSAYEIHLNPIYGLYLLVVTIVLVGATWTCCKFSKREKRDGSGIPYQQLEMGAQPQTSSAVDSPAEDGWNDDWDDDWDDEAVTRPSEKYTSEGVSVNGLTSRTPKEDGWDSAWDD
ncbi:hypothetical protein Cni_G04199 [Canna indica]|uniref:DUF7356 domain-containing protein n=1 Tax=Canna indica TaxID=4628 RepID=A0AAQ3JV12_9LILI|nr:hypothetical protein Cni_G04199 [Canna indica]